MDNITTSILHQYFATVTTLKLYLFQILDQPEAFVPTEQDSPEYHDLVNNSYVAQQKAGPSIVFNVVPPMADMREVLEVSQRKLLRSSAAQNVITSGYRQNSKQGHGITNYAVNTVVTALQNHRWDSLLTRIGVDAMIHLLTETSLFIPMPNQCLCQMTGEPVVNLKQIKKPSEKRAQNEKSGHSRKRLKLNDGTAKVSEVSGRSPVDVSLTRHRIFYSRPVLRPHSNHIVVGLPSQHILNQLVESHSKSRGDVPDKAQEANARSLAKDVFRRQYGLPSAFDPQNFKFQPPMHFDKETEIKCKTPKRLKETLGILEKLLWRHGKCKYGLLRDKVCPSKVVSKENTKPDDSVILEMMSERSIRLKSQMSLPSDSFDSAGHRIFPQDLTQAKEVAKNKPRFVEYSCTHFEVYRYVIMVTKSVIPEQLWGNETNFKLVRRHVKKIVACRRFETISLHELVQSFSTSACDWLMPPGSGAKQARVPVSDAIKRRELLEDFLFWYFESFVLALLKTAFYVTDSSAFRNQVLYFRHDDWRDLCEPLIRRLTENTFQKLSQAEAEQVLRQRKLGFSFVRLLPKETGVRPIVNLKRRNKKPGTVGGDLSINQILQAAFSILTYEKQRHPHLLGASVFSPDDIYGKLKMFKRQLQQDGSSTLPKFYFVKVDVQACFDSIEQTKLLEILRDLISEDVYSLQRHGQVFFATGKVKKQYVKNAVPDDEDMDFLEYAAQLANAVRHTIFVDQVIYPRCKKQEVLNLLEEHITENIVKIGSDHYRQMVGIPQGSVLSTLLCSFFYGDLEKRFGEFTADGKSVLFRMIDDYMLITTNLANARKFLDMMNKGHPEYGCFISKDKTMTNFDYDAQILNVTGPRQTGFPWCGFDINMKDLSISVDYTRYQGASLRDSLTVDRGRHRTSVFRNKMLQLAKARSHIIYSDCELNTKYTVHLNIYQNFLLTAMKMHGYLSDCLDLIKNQRFIHTIIKQLVLYCYAAIRSKKSTAAFKASNGQISLQKLDVVWLGNHAFHSVLRRKPHRYEQLINSLAFELSRSVYRRCSRRFGSLVLKGAEAMAQITF